MGTKIMLVVAGNIDGGKWDYACPLSDLTDMTLCMAAIAIILASRS